MSQLKQSNPLSPRGREQLENSNTTVSPHPPLLQIEDQITALEEELNELLHSVVLPMMASVSQSFMEASPPPEDWVGGSPTLDRIAERVSTCRTLASTLDDALNNFKSQLM